MARIKQRNIENPWKQAYAGLEHDFGDLVATAKIAAEKALDDDDGGRIFTAIHLCDRVEDFQARWREGHAQAIST